MLVILCTYLQCDTSPIKKLDDCLGKQFPIMMPSKMVEGNESGFKLKIISAVDFANPVSSESQVGVAIMIQPYVSGERNAP